MSIYLPKSVRSIGRLQTIVRVLAGNGFEHLIQRLNLGRYLPFQARWPRARPLESEEPTLVGRRLVKVCQELGPTFVKMGQMLSSRPDLLPERLVQELHRLQDQVEPFDTDIAKRIIADDLGAPVEQCFEQFGDTVLASGSVAQTYLARARRGRQVVVKVKRPGIEDVIERDVHLLYWLADAVERFIPESRPYRPRMLVDEFHKTIRRELDFINEAATMARFADAFRDDPGVRIADVLWDLTGTRVLTMGYLEGRSLQKVIDSPDGEFDRPQLARNLVDTFFTQYFELGMFHGDPHPGNILVSDSARIGLVDFGMIGQISDELNGQLLMALVAVLNREVDIVVDTLDDLDALSPDTNHAQLSRDLRDLLNKYYGLPLKRLELHTIFEEVTQVLRVNQVALPRDMVLLFKSLVTVAGVATQLDPDLNLLPLLKPRLQKVVRARLSPDRLVRSLGITGWHLVSILRQIPRQMRDMMRRLGRGQWRINIRHQNLDYLASELDRSSNRLAFSVIIAAIIISSSLILSTAESSTILGVPIKAFGVLGYVFAGIMGVGLVWAIWRSGKLS